MSHFVVDENRSRICCADAFEGRWCVGGGEIRRGLFLPWFNGLKYDMVVSMAAVGGTIDD